MANPSFRKWPAKPCQYCGRLAIYRPYGKPAHLTADACNAAINAGTQTELTTPAGFRIDDALAER